MSDRLGFNTELEMEHLKKIVNKDDSITLSSRFTKYLIEQAEQVQELEETNKKNYWIAADFKFENLKLEQQNKRYREAIDYVMTAEATQYRSLENALEDIKFVINETLESD